MTKEKPLLLLDIDGVLNVFANSRGFRRVEIGGYTIHLNPEHVEIVQAFEEKFDVVWSTMWQAQARSDFAPEAGFGHAWRHIDFDAHWNDVELMEQVLAQTRNAGARLFDQSVGNYKHPGFVATVADRAAVIVDDDLELWQHDWALQRSLDIPTALVQPDPFVGLTREHAETILEFAECVQDATIPTNLR